jgi:hypothetical protein
MPEKTAFFYFYLTFCSFPGEISGLAILSEAEKNNPPCGGDSLPPNWGEVE